MNQQPPPLARLESLASAAQTAEQRGDVASALARYRELLAIDSEHPGALWKLARSDLQGVQTHDNAIDMLRRALASARLRRLAAQSLPIHTELIVALRERSVTERLDAVRSALFDCGEVPGLIWEECECLRALGQNDERLLRLNRLAALQPRDAVVLAELGLALMGSNSAQQAITPMRNAVALGHSDTEFLLLLASIEIQIGEFAAARQRLDDLLRADSDNLGALGLRWHLAAHECDWPTIAKLERPMLEKIRLGEVHPVFTPWRLLASSVDGKTLRDYTLAYAKRTTHEPVTLTTKSRSATDSDLNRRIRVGYLSSDFHEHATSLLMAGLFERHDTTRFECFAYSYGARVTDAYRARMHERFEHWCELNTLSDESAAALIASHGIDVLIELKGHTYGARPGIAARRPAPVQAHYLGYPGTTGLAGIDYFIADETTVPARLREDFVEAVVALPGCYQANDNRRDRPPPAHRSDIGLAEDAVVLCNFNQSWKWSEAFVRIWMRALQQHEKTILWLLDPGANHPAKVSVASLAKSFGVSERVVWAINARPREHLSRLAVADLALDQLPCCSHTTAADALWMGIPLLAITGDTFASRVSTSICKATNPMLPIALDLIDYEAKLERLLTHPDELLSLRTSLEASRNTCALFDTEGFARKWEAMLSDLAHRVPPPRFTNAI